MGKNKGIVEVDIPYSCRTCGYCVKIQGTDERICMLLLRQPVYECVRFSPGRRTDGIWRGSTGRNPEAVAGTSSIQKWVLEGFAGSCLQMHPAIWKRQAGVGCGTRQIILCVENRKSGGGR